MSASGLVDKIVKRRGLASGPFDYSILIPTWNNLPFLRFCVRSIKENSSLRPQIIVAVNEGLDGTRAWIEAEQDLDFVAAPDNIGICYALNACRSLVRSDYIVYLNDDMYVLPGWDEALINAVKDAGSRAFMYSATMIEPVEVRNPSWCAVVHDYGKSVDDFREAELLSNFQTHVTSDWSGSTWPPNIVHVDVWDLVGGMSIEFSPGMYSDPDFSRKLYEIGVRDFKGFGNSLVYHFGEKSTRRVSKNNGRKMFLMKWGITSRTFIQDYLRIGEPHEGNANGELKPGSAFLNKVKRLLSAFK